MSALNKNLAAQLDEQFPPEFDEKWVNKLLTDTETKDTTLKSISQRKQTTARELTLLEAEIRKQRIIRKSKPPVSERDKNINQIRKSPLSAIERQKQCHKESKKLSHNSSQKLKSKGIIGRTLSRMVGR